MVKMLLTVNQYWAIYIEVWKKIAENQTIIQYMPYVTRLDYLAPMFTKEITVNGLEQLGNILIPKRANYNRVIMLELSRIASHMLWLGPFMADIGPHTPFFYIFRERVLVYDLFKATNGMRMMHNYFLIRGVATNLPYGWIDKCLDFSSKIQWDFHKVDHYECYDEFDWEVQWKKKGRFISSKKPSPTFEFLKRRTLCESQSPKGRIMNFSNRGSECFSLEMENPPSKFYQFANSSLVS
ncbi:hypothetical protein UlMin_030753 [Ulmus minor]